jgi:hypothetical protein
VVKESVINVNIYYLAKNREWGDRITYGGPGTCECGDQCSIARNINPTDDRAEIYKAKEAFSEDKIIS